MGLQYTHVRLGNPHRETVAIDGARNHAAVSLCPEEVLESPEDATTAEVAACILVAYVPGWPGWQQFVVLQQEYTVQQQIKPQFGALFAAHRREAPQ